MTHTITFREAPVTNRQRIEWAVRVEHSDAHREFWLFPSLSSAKRAVSAWLSDPSFTAGFGGYAAHYGGDLTAPF